MAVLRARRTLFILLLAAVLAALTHSIWLSVLGGYLVRADLPTKADYAVVLAGDGHGNRVLTAAELVRQGLVKKAIVSGPCCYYGIPESDLAVAFAVRQGYPEDYFIKAPHDATSTQEEVGVLMSLLRRLGATSFLLVTSNYHTRRAGRYFTKVTGGMTMHVIAAPDPNFQAKSWWQNREGQKVFYMEWSKTIASVFGM